ncbi:UDP-N-acetylmuramoyl-L-alanyl-D-glutamate--2,6-diaminopimelate ligase [Microbacterium pseudoresistens]|uniref:UDP-N-acetylmuramyl-tripeptide synthetase n=1 Tax=Microbacterium pseudoresistens TaxID=640634 RepID=A0A7Y9ET03_9MICO|nr:UDP-N-acetylmuramoyl-L-alanyl-D-glutamate--2,6-diaminopimelate ligase [Microbacterium pseudoresistens]NYD53194.1 UDP-N-acetylmuramoyl-L-alanyl-D-glutamate--2,6-diaminopimelate ligase [Microbacterium pseudoresistens]
MPAHTNYAAPRLDSRPVETFAATLGELSARLGVAPPARAGITYTGLTMATDAVRAGDLFIAAPGARTHGARFAEKARAAGATAVLTDAAGAALLPDDLPALIVDDVRAAAGPAAAHLYRDPAASLTTVGITGTQGKTTTAFYVAAAAGMDDSGTIGSIGTTVRDVLFPPELTTPEAPELQALLAVMREQGLRTVAVEASSHALVLGRVGGFAFDAGIFLNLGHDHRDFHPTQAEYFDAKARLLTPAHARVAIVDVDSHWGRRAAERASIPVRTISALGDDADWRAENVELRADGSSFDIRSPEGETVRFRTQLTGAFNVDNILTAVAALAETGRTLEEMVPGIAALPSVEGRLQRFDFGQPFTAIVDSAHKPEAINAALRAVRTTSPEGRLIAVLGANGNRDAAKRRMMGRFAAMHADVLVVTDDNPYDDDPDEIRATLIAGARSSDVEVVEIGDRREAMAAAVRMARPEDTVVILGKGHERYHALAGGEIAWYDPDVLREVIEAL